MFGEIHWMQNSKHRMIPILQKYAYKKTERKYNKILIVIIICS